MSRRTVLFLGSAVAAIVAAATVAAWPSAFVGAQPDVQVRAYMPLVLKSFGGSLPRPPTVVPPTPTPAPTNTRGPTATTTNTRPPTATRTPTATPTPTGPAWLQYVNYHRSLAKLPALTKNDVWGAGGQKHSKYMVKNDVGGHTEDPRKPYYSQEGHDAAQNGNVAAYSAPNVPAEWAIDGWMTAPFHQLQIINPRLAISGFGDYSEGQGMVGPNQAFDIQYGAVLDVLRGRVEDLPTSVRFPVHYPEQDQAIPNLLYDGGESPNPLAYCSGYKEPTGPPLLLLLGGDAAPKVSKTSFKDERGTELPHCWFDETKVKSPEAAFLVLARDHAVVVMPRSRLTANARYTLTITSGGTAYSWSFKAGPERGQPLPPVWQSEMVEPGLAGQ